MSGIFQHTDLVMVVCLSVCGFSIGGLRLSVLAIAKGNVIELVLVPSLKSTRGVLKVAYSMGNNRKEISGTFLALIISKIITHTATSEANMEQHIPLPQIIDHLAAALGKKQSGVFFIATDKNESARLGLADGQITRCSFGRLHGADALNGIQKINTAKCSFAANSRFPFRDKDHVEHQAAMLTLAIPVSINDKTPIRPEAATKQAPPTTETNTIIYRGKVVQAPEKKVKSDSGKNTQKPKKGQRVYRGKVIDADD